LIAGSLAITLCHAAETKPATNTPAFYRMAQLEDAKQRAAAEGKPKEVLKKIRDKESWKEKR